MAARCARRGLECIPRDRLCTRDMTAYKRRRLKVPVATPVGVFGPVLQSATFKVPSREIAIGTQPSVTHWDGSHCSSEPKSTRETTEQALIALAAKMKALQARNEELEARVAVMQADKKQPQADASQCCYIFPPFHLPIYIPVCRLLRKEG